MLYFIVLFLYVFFVLVQLSVLAKRLARKTPLRASICIKEIISIKTRWQDATLCFSVECIVSLFYCLFVPGLYAIYSVLIWHDIVC